MSYEPLKRGSRGDKVLQWQRFLHVNHYDVGPRGPDGDFGFFTENATDQLQTHYGLGNQDGVVDAQTWLFGVKFNFQGISEGPAPAPAIKAPAAVNLLKPSAKGYQTILDFEVGGGKAYYEKYLLRPTLPGGASGITIGIGFDLRYNNVPTFNKFWGPRIDEPAASALRKFCGFQYADKSSVLRLANIKIPWKAAEEVFQEDTIPRFWALTMNTFPGVELLCPEGQWALLSLVFNRGGSLVGDRRRHMKKIMSLLQLAKLDGVISGPEVKQIAQCFRDMTSIWSGSDIYTGMYRRRNAEANLLLSCA